jgi:N-acetylglucosaminyldiphosphoundecaprenol N-acetyl-beta-D-mannosaminyltransferase
MYKASKIFDLEIFAESKAKLLELLGQELKTNKLIKIFTPNPEQIVLASENKEFEKVLKQADILIPDGAGLVLASKILFRFNKNNQAIRQRITGVDLVQDLLGLAKKNNWRVLVLGGKNYQNSIENSDVNFLEAYRDVKNPTDFEEAIVVKKIQEFKPEIVLVAFGAPSQENWIINHQQILEKNKIKVVMSVGGSFDFLLGKVKRAPNWLGKLGFEWLFRLIQEPWRWRRQLRLVKFVSLVFGKLVN